MPRHLAFPTPSPRLRHAAGVRTLLVLLVAAVVVGGGSLLTTRASEAAVPGYSARQNISDGFQRSVAKGFGVATKGGAYRVSTTTRTSVAKKGRVALTPGAGVVVSLPGISSRDQRAAVTVSPSAVPAAGNGLYVAVQLRTQSNGDTYRARMHIARGGKVLLSVSRVVGGKETDVVGEVAVPVTSAAGRSLVLDAYVVGTTQVTVGVRVSVAGAPVPAWQRVATDTSAARITKAGAVGVWSYLSASTAATSVALTSLQGWSLEQTAPVPPTTTAPSTTAPSTSPTTPAPTSAAPSTTAPSSAAPTTTAPTSTAPSSAAPSTSTPADPSTPPTGSGEQPVGSLPVGAAKYPVPAGALFVAPNGSDSNAGTLAAPLRTIQAAVSRVSPGGAVVVRAGSYHESVTVGANRPFTLQNFPGEAVWLDGTTPLTQWTKTSAGWVYAGWTASFDHSPSFTKGGNDGMVGPANPMAAYPDQVFVNGVQLQQVAAGTTPAAGQFAIDEAAQTLTVGSDPTGRSVRASDLERALVVYSPTTIRGIGVRGYATPLSSQSTVYINKAPGTVLENVVVEDNAGQGLSMYGSAGTVVRHVTSRDNGMLGIGAHQTDDLVVEDCSVTGNNTQLFKPAPSAAGMKFTASRRIAITGNVVVDNKQVNGIWLDASVVGFVIARNVVTVGSDNYGILAELSDEGIVAGNRVTGAKYGFTAFDSGGIQVYNNVFTDSRVWDIGLAQDARRQATAGNHPRDKRYPLGDPTNPWIVRNITIANNVFTATPGTTRVWFEVYGMDASTNRSMDEMNVTIDGNLFSAGPGKALVGWGQGDNKTVTYYKDTASLAQAKGPKWTNGLVDPAASASFKAAPTAYGIPIPADVAKVLGVATGTRKVGP